MKFLRQNRTTFTMMLRCRTLETLQKEITDGLVYQPDAFGFQMEGLSAENKTAAFFDGVFSAMDGKPVYITNYHRSNSDKTLTDEVLVEQLFCTLESAKKYCSAVLIDLMGNLFDREAEGEISWNPAVAERQSKLIDEIHANGGEVLMSSHVLKYLPTDDVLAIANAHKERGADIAKIVTSAGNNAELEENFRTTIALRSLGLPSLFLCNGSHCNLHRMLGPALGSCMFLCTGDNVAKNPQPKIKLVNELYDALEAHIR